MKILTRLIVLVYMILVMGGCAQLKNLGIGTQGSGGLTEEKIAQGLKEALRIGSKDAINIVGRTDGFFGNQLIKILLPPEVQKIESTLRTVGLGNYVDDFALSLNRAAEKASGEAFSIFVDAITQMTIGDAINILNGPNDAATQYFKEKTSLKLENMFRPIVNDALNSVGATKTYNDLTAKVKTIPFVNIEMTDLETYVTGKALDGLFLMIAKEEEKIRTYPAARVTQLLRDVFGK
ncbi:MAG: DUF4197 domain-containing protein [Melioribacteraceae bacterium]|nr:DUF4197 domain-containing protein [Melioribacteraceae bacterium]